MAALTWSPPSRDDDAAWMGLLAAIETADRRGETYDLHDLADEWASVWAQPDTDATFGWDGRDLVAFGWLRSMPGRREAHRIWCWGGVHPARRGEGIGTGLLRRQLDQASRVAARLDPALPAEVLLDVTVDQQALRAVAERLGFAPVRVFLDLARSTSPPLPSVAPPADLERTGWRDALDEPTRLAHQAAFADHWGSEPRSAQEWQQWYTGHRAFRPDLSVLAVDPATGAVAGYVLCAAYPQDWGAAVPSEAWVTSIGTQPSWRGRGVARWLLTDSLQRIALSDTGFQRAILGVDADNPTGALDLYQSLGFAEVRRITTYQHLSR